MCKTSVLNVGRQLQLSIRQFQRKYSMYNNDCNSLELSQILVTKVTSTFYHIYETHDLIPQLLNKKIQNVTTNKNININFEIIDLEWNFSSLHRLFLVDHTVLDGQHLGQLPTSGDGSQHWYCNILHFVYLLEITIFPNVACKNVIQLPNLLFSL